MQEITIKLWRNTDVRDWSIEINGLRHLHVSAEIADSLVEASMVTAEQSLLDGEPAATMNKSSRNIKAAVSGV
jgi:hypothetical protein